MADVLMPQLGETVTTGTIVKWCKQVGDYVAEDDPLFEVSTDKIDTEIPSHLEGTLTAILVAEGETAPIGTVIATIGAADDVVLAAPTMAMSAPDHVAGISAGGPVDDVQVSNARSASTVSADDDLARHVITPVVSQLAALHGVDLAAVVGTGTGGRVTKSDVLAAAQFGSATTQHVEPQSSLPDIVEARAISTNKSVDALPVLVADGDHRVALSRARVRAAANLRASVDEAVHTLVVIEADYTNVWQLREEIKADFKASEGFSLTFLPFIARAVCDALHDYPHINAALDMTAATEPVLVVRKHVNLGVAVDLSGEGLIVPVVQRAEELRLRGLARAVNDLAQRARAKHLGPDDFVGGTFTLTNAGGYGTLHTAPIMQRGQVGIIGTDAVQHRAVAVEQAPGQWGLAAKPIGNLSFSFDHRAFDGAYASQFLREVADRIAQHNWRTEL